MAPTPRIKVVFSLAALAAAGCFLVFHFWSQHGPSERAFFYDLSERKLFTAPRELIPPIKGLNGSEEDGVRAVVISTNGHPENKKTWRIAYLEKYSPELKRQIEEARRKGGSPEMGREIAQANRFVRREAETEWHPMITPEGQLVASEWTNPSADGSIPAVCTP